jgi:hypothetical protein
VRSRVASTGSSSGFAEVNQNVGSVGPGGHLSRRRGGCGRPRGGRLPRSCGRPRSPSDARDRRRVRWGEPRRSSQARQQRPGAAIDRVAAVLEGSRDLLVGPPPTGPSDVLVRSCPVPASRRFFVAAPWARSFTADANSGWTKLISSPETSTMPARAAMAARPPLGRGLTAAATSGTVGRGSIDASSRISPVDAGSRWAVRGGPGGFRDGS